MPTSRDSDPRQVVVALAGRRIDEPGAEPQRFPLERAPQTQDRIKDLLLAKQASALVCSAGCGADLLALEAAEELGIPSRIVLPFDRDVFRRTSVTDRPGDWGERYDVLLDAAEGRGDLMLLHRSPDDADAYPAANEAILDNASALAQQAGHAVLAVMVWDGQSRGPDDMTEHFRSAAERRGLPVAFIPTL